MGRARGPERVRGAPRLGQGRGAGGKDESQRYFVGQWARVALPGTARLLADMFQRSAVKEEVVAMTKRGIARLERLLDGVAADASQPVKIREAAKALMAAAPPS